MHLTACRSLPGCGLEGTLPAALAQLVQLKDLDLSGNALTGSIPQDWTVAGAFTALEKLQLGACGCCCQLWTACVCDCDG